MEEKKNCCCCCNAEAEEGKISAVGGADFDDGNDSDDELGFSLSGEESIGKSSAVNNTSGCCCCGDTASSSSDAEHGAVNCCCQSSDNTKSSEETASNCCCCCGEDAGEGKLSAVGEADFDDDQDNEEELCCSLFSQKIPEKSDTVKKTRKTCC